MHDLTPPQRLSRVHFWKGGIHTDALPILDRHTVKVNGKRRTLTPDGLAFYKEWFVE